LNLTPLRVALGVGVIGSAACADVLAQFGASGGPSRTEELLVQVPWFFIAAILGLAWFGPAALRRICRRISKHAFVAYFFVQTSLFVCVIAFRLLFGAMALPLLSVGGLFLIGLVFSGILIVTFMAVSLIVIGAQTYWTHR
jgi:hypothetical protein